MPQILKVSCPVAIQFANKKNTWQSSQQASLPNERIAGRLAQFIDIYFLRFQLLIFIYHSQWFLSSFQAPLHAFLHQKHDQECNFHLQARLLVVKELLAKWWYNLRYNQLASNVFWSRQHLCCWSQAMQHCNAWFLLCLFVLHQIVSSQDSWG